MVEFDCDNKEIETTLRKLYKQVISNGGIVHEKLKIGSKNGDFQITVDDSVPDGEEIVVLPRECLLPVDKYKLELNDNKIVMLSHDEDLNDGQVDMMNTMIELFNLTEKIETQEVTSTFSLKYDDKNLLDRILKSRSENGIPFHEEREKMSENTYALSSFLITRTLSIKDAENCTGSVEVMMPIIDCLNHHANAQRFSPHVSEVSSPGVKHGAKVTHIAVVKSCPVEGSKECYVSYGPYDSMDALIQYNFPDESAYFVRSVPVRIDLPGGIGCINIRSMASEPQSSELPDKFKGLENYMPTINVNVMKDVVNLNFLLIPSTRAPNAMRRILALVLSSFELNLGQNQMMEILRYVEKYIINENIIYFEELSEHLKNYSPKPAVKLIVENARKVVATQLKHVKSYELLEQTLK